MEVVQYTSCVTAFCLVSGLMLRLLVHRQQLVRHNAAFNHNNHNRIQRHNSRFFDNVLTAPRTVSNTYAQVVQLCANHVQHIEYLSHATCHVTCHVVQRDSSAFKFDRVKIAFV